MAATKELPVVDETEEVFVLKSEIFDASREAGRNALTRTVKLYRSPELERVPLLEHLAQVDTELQQLAALGFNIPDYEWCLVPEEHLGDKMYYRDYNPLIGPKGYRLGARVEVIEAAINDLTKAELTFTCDSIFRYQNTRTEHVLADTYSHQVVSSRQQLFYVDIEPMLIPAG